MSNPSSSELRGARFISLSRQAASDEAHQLTAAVLALILPKLKRSRPVGPASRVRLAAETAAILAGLFRHGPQGGVVAAQRRKAGGMWQRAALGNLAFWSKVDAMEAAGLVGIENGVRTFSEATGMIGGLASKVWPTQRLIDLAAAHGVQGDGGTGRVHWSVKAAGSAARHRLEKAQLVTLKDWQATDERPMTVPEKHATAAMRDRLERTNAFLARAKVDGCTATVLQRKFIHCLSLGGRRFAVGHDNFQNIKRSERKTRLYINGEATAEADLHASFLSIFLAMTEKNLPTDNMYALQSVPADAVKQWMVQTFSTGKHVVQWSQKAAKDVRLIRPKDVRNAACLAYPALCGDLARIIPADIRGTLPADHGTAVGHYLTFIESEIVGDAMDHLHRAGIVALPIHDALIVPVSHGSTAKAALEQAFQQRLGVLPHVKLTPGGA